MAKYPMSDPNRNGKNKDSITWYFLRLLLALKINHANLDHIWRSRHAYYNRRKEMSPLSGRQGTPQPSDDSP